MYKFKIKSWTISGKSPILNVWQRSEYAFEIHRHAAVAVNQSFFSKSAASEKSWEQLFLNLVMSRKAIRTLLKVSQNLRSDKTFFITSKLERLFCNWNTYYLTNYCEIRNIAMYESFSGAVFLYFKITQLSFTCSKSTMQAPEQGLKSAQS